MGPKKKKGKKNAIVGQYSVEDMTKPELEAYALKLQEEITWTEQRMEEYVLEKNEIEILLENTKKELDLKKKYLLGKECQLKDLQNSCERDMDEKDAQVEYLKQENLQVLLDKTIELNLEHAQYEEGHLEEEKITIDRLQRKDMERNSIQGAYVSLIEKMRQMKCENVSKVIQHYEGVLNKLSSMYDALFEDLCHSINEQKKESLKAAEKSRNHQIREIEQNRSQNFQAMREYFNRLSFDFLALIKDLGQKLEFLKKREKEYKMAIAKATKENDLLLKHKEEAESRYAQLEQYDKDKITFAKSRRTMHKLIEKVKELELENIMVNQQLETVEKNKKSLMDQFYKSAGKIQQSTNLKSIILSRKLTALNSMLEETELTSAVETLTDVQESVRGKAGPSTAQSKTSPS